MSLGLYIQVPFCQTKCTYCNFHTGPFSRSLYDPYVLALCREISGHGLVGAGLSRPSATVDTLYIGGGTPSLLDPAALARILDTVRSSFPCSLEEVTLEADPETITAEKAAAWLAAGINRISLGSQSFNDAELRPAGRLHRRDDIFAADRILRAAGFRNLSFDLIAGLPHQTAASWRDSLDQLLSLAPEHISIYMMEIDEGSRLGREVLSGGSRYSASALPDDDSIASFYELACDLLSRSGYDHYEISNWARREDVGAGFSRPSSLPALSSQPTTLNSPLRSRHNLKYWLRHPYLGLGAGAHSFDGHARWANAHDPAAYLASITADRLPIEQREELTPQMALDEELFLGLRLLDGINWQSLEHRYNVPLRPRLESLARDGLLLLDGPRARLAPSRLSISNLVFSELLS